MKWIAFLSFLITLPFSNTLNSIDGISSNLQSPTYITYKIEVWLFLILFSILIIVIYKKKLGTSNVTVENKSIDTAKARQNYVADEYDSTPTEVPIDIPTKVDFSYDDIQGEVTSEKIETNVSSSDLAKKLKELKK